MKIANKNLSVKILLTVGAAIIFLLGWIIGGLNGEVLQIIALLSIVLSVMANKNLSARRRFIVGLIVVIAVVVVCLITFLSGADVGEGLEGIRRGLMVITVVVISKGWHLK